jgi:Excalibur calcium-binding domain
VGTYHVLFVSALGKYLALAGLLALLLAAAACSGQPESDAPQDDVQKQDQNRPEGGEARKTDPVLRLLNSEETDWAIGERVELGSVSLRVFAVRSEDVVYFAPGPGQGVGVEDSGSGEFLAVDFVAQNDSESRVTVRPEAILGDDSGTPHRPDGSVRVPNLVDGAMELEAGQKRASTLFFDVPNGTTPERLGLLVFGEEARIDLLSDRQDRVPPDDYLRVYHLYFAQKAYEEAYEMYDPATTQDITQGDWLTFYEPLWGNRYIGLDSLTRVFVAQDEASFEMDRTFYDRDGEPVAAPPLNAPVLQDMVRSDGAWRLVMGQDLISDIGAEVPRFAPPSETETTAPDDSETTAPETTDPETTAPETTAPETTAPETTASPAADYSCADFQTQEEAQSYLMPGDPSYVLDPDGDGLACEGLP